MCEALSNLGLGVRGPSFDVSLRSMFVFAVRRSRFQDLGFYLNFKSMLLGQFCTINSIPESILDDYGNIMKKN